MRIWRAVRGDWGLFYLFIKMLWLLYYWWFITGPNQKDLVGTLWFQFFTVLLLTKSKTYKWRDYTQLNILFSQYQ